MPSEPGFSDPTISLMTETTMPRQLKTVRILLWLQAVANTLLGILLAMLAVTALEHGRDDALPMAVAVLSLVIGVVLVACAIMLGRGVPWVRHTVMFVEAVTVLFNLISLINGGGPSLLVGIGIAIAILIGLSKAEVVAWFNRAA